MHGAEVPHALPVEPKAALRPGHRIAFFIRRFLLLPAQPARSVGRAARLLCWRRTIGGRACQSSRNGGAIGGACLRRARRAAARAPPRRSTTGAAKSSRAVSPSRRRSMPSGSMPVIRQPAPARPSRSRRIKRHGVGMVGVDLGEDRRLGRGERAVSAAEAAGRRPRSTRSGRTRRPDGRARPRPGRAGNRRSRHRPRLDGWRAVKRAEQARIGDRLGPAEHGQPRPGERVGVALGRRRAAARRAGRRRCCGCAGRDRRAAAAGSRRDRRRPAPARRRARRRGWWRAPPGRSGAIGRGRSCRNRGAGRSRSCRK